MNRFGFLSGVLLTLLGSFYLQAYETLGKEWAIETINYKINQNGTYDCDGEFDAVQRAFDSWSEISTCGLSFEYGGTTIYSPTLGDGENTIVWFIAWPFPDDWIAVTLMDTMGGAIDECDLCFNNENCTWSTTGNPNRDDVENVTAHEAGHWVGLDDLFESYDTEKTMYDYIPLGETKKRTLESDDIAGASYLYPYVPTWPSEGQAEGLTTYVSSLYLTIYSTNLKQTRRT